MKPLPDGILLLGGTCRAGKSLLSARMRRKTGIATVSLDADLRANIRDGHSSDPYVTGRVNAADSYFPRLQTLVEVQGGIHGSVLIEGDLILPRHVRHLQQNPPDNTTGDKIHGVFIVLTEPNLDQIVGNEGSRGWFHKQSATQQAIVLDEVAEYGRYIADECSDLGIACFDLSRDWAAQHRAARRALGELWNPLVTQMETAFSAAEPSLV